MMCVISVVILDDCYEYADSDVVLLTSWFTVTYNTFLNGLIVSLTTVSLYMS